jgi:hypothetical protein
MKRSIAIISVLLFSLLLTGCGSNNQASAIKDACDLAVAKDYDGTSVEFMEIARNNSGYIDAAAGARIWAKEKGEVMPEFNTFLSENVYTNIYGIKPNAFGIVYHNLQSFYTLCGFELQK